jgi:hypothetical protein
MDLPTESMVSRGPSGASSRRRGIALPSAMFALVAAGILAAGMFAFADLAGKATMNQERSTRAMHVAEAGLYHAVSLLRGSLRMHNFNRIFRGGDGLLATADDGTLNIGGTYPGFLAADQIPLAGRAFEGGTYFVTVTDDPPAADGDANAMIDLNGRVVVRCRAVMADGSSADVSAIVGSIPQPGFAADGNAAFAGSPNIFGPCGGAHANGNISSTGGGPDIATQVSATGTVTGSWHLHDGSNAPKVPGADPIDIPDLTPADYCTGTQADFRLLPGGVAQNSAGGGIAVPLGWAWEPATLTWRLTGVAGVPLTPPGGTYCVTGNAYVQGAVGTAAAPRVMSVIASGSIRIEGTPYIRADHDDGILALAGGDLYLAGNAAAGATSYSGMLYARAQCVATGNFVAVGQLLCANNAQPLGATEWSAVHDIAGNFSLSFDCSANVFNKRRVLYWYPRIGT